MTASFKLKPLLASLGISLGTGILSGVLSSGSMNIYEELVRPPFAPPAWLFPVVWTILYALMGVSAYLVYSQQSDLRRAALVVYAVQLAVNFVWPLIFFNLGAYNFALAWLILLFLLVLAMTVLFFKVRPLAGYLQIPYLIWLLIATYLNAAIVVLN